MDKKEEISIDQLKSSYTIKVAKKTNRSVPRTRQTTKTNNGRLYRNNKKENTKMTKKDAEDINTLIEIYCDITESWNNKNMPKVKSDIMRLGNWLSKITKENYDKLGYIWDYHDQWKNHS